MSSVPHAPTEASTLRDLIALTKPRITLMVVLTAAGGMWLAPGATTPQTILVALAALASVVSGANALNCWLERDVDRHMARTKNRPLPAGRLAPKWAFTLGIALGTLPSTGAVTVVALPSWATFGFGP